VIEITHNCEKPNGIAMSPDQTALYLIDHNNGTDEIDPAKPAPKKGAMKVYAFPLDKDGLVGGERTTIVDYGTEDGADGMAVDVKGNIYLASRGLKRPGILVVNPRGEEIAFIPTAEPQPGAKKPVGIPSNVAFGIGKESKTLYITIDVSLYRIPVKVDGFHIPWASKRSG
jgi:gluconolactonase